MNSMTSGVWKQSPNTRGQNSREAYPVIQPQHRRDPEPDVELKKEAQRQRQDGEKADEHTRKE
jgi:hypothetical protein